MHCRSFFIDCTLIVLGHRIVGTPLHVVVKLGDLKLVLFLVGAGADVNKVNR
jgi:hypothetical protein